MTISEKKCLPNSANIFSYIDNILLIIQLLYFFKLKSRIQFKNSWSLKNHKKKLYLIKTIKKNLIDILHKKIAVKIDKIFKL